MSTRQQAIVAEARYIAHLYEVHPAPSTLSRIEERLSVLYDHALGTVRRIPEPGWGAIVEAGAYGDRKRWVRGEKGWTNLDAGGPYLNWTSWPHLVDPALVRPGVE